MATVSTEGYEHLETPTGQQPQLQHSRPEREDFKRRTFIQESRFPQRVPAQVTAPSDAAPPFPKNMREENRFGPLSPGPAMEAFVPLINSHYKQI